MDVVTPSTTLAVILGAHQWPKASLRGGGSYLESATAIKDYFLDQQGLGIARDNLLDLFDEEAAASDLMLTLGKWLKARQQ